MSDRIEVTDFRHAGYLQARGFRFAGTHRDGREVVFIFEGREADALRALDEYVDSPERRYDAACKAMHDLTRVRVRKGQGTR